MATATAPSTAPSSPLPSLRDLLRVGIGVPAGVLGVLAMVILPRPTMSNACRSGTPAFIIVASWRVKIAMSLGLIFAPERILRFLTFVGVTP